MAIRFCSRRSASQLATTTRTPSPHGVCGHRQHAVGQQRHDESNSLPQRSHGVSHVTCYIYNRGARARCTHPNRACVALNAESTDRMSTVDSAARACPWHLCGWIERIPGGSRQKDGLETGMMGGHGRESSVLASVPLSVSQVYHVLWGEVLVAQFGWDNQLARPPPSLSSLQDPAASHRRPASLAGAG